MSATPHQQVALAICEALSKKHEEVLEADTPTTFQTISAGMDVVATTELPK